MTRSLIVTYGIVIFALVAVIVLVVQPDKWTRAVIVKICHDGTRILRLEDGSHWARYQARSFAVENPDTVCPVRELSH